MKLEVYLKTKRLKKHQFAETIGVSRATVSRWCSGTMRPDWTLMQKIETVTDGTVKAQDFYE